MLGQGVMLGHGQGVPEACGVELGHGQGVPEPCGVELGHGHGVPEACGVELGHGHGVPEACGVELGHGQGVPEPCGVGLGHGVSVGPGVGVAPRTVPPLATAGSALPIAARATCPLRPIARSMATEKTNPRRIWLSPIPIGWENHLPIG